MPVPTRITCIQCDRYLEGHGDTVQVAQLLLGRAIVEGWVDRDGDGWYCPECHERLFRPRVNGQRLGGAT